jgi:hypothetical protein
MIPERKERLGVGRGRKKGRKKFLFSSSCVIHGVHLWPFLTGGRRDFLCFLEPPARWFIFSTLSYFVSLKFSLLSCLLVRTS